MPNIISFDALGLSFTVDPVAFSIAERPIYWYGILIAIGFLLAFAYVFWRAQKEQINTDKLFDLIFISLPVAILGSRLFYILGDLPSFQHAPWWKIFAVWEGGISILGGLIGACLTCLIYCKVNRLPALNLLDLCAPGIMIGQMIGRWGNFVNAEVYGCATQLPWAMHINGKPGVHPLFLYESCWLLIGLVALLVYYPHRRRNGEIFCLYVFWYGLGRMFLEGLRDTQFVLRISGLPLSQLTALGMLFAAIAGWVILHVKRPR